MNNLFVSSLARLRKDEAGQGLVEYLLILALLPRGIGSLASGLHSAFSAGASTLGDYIS